MHLLLDPDAEDGKASAAEAADEPASAEGPRVSLPSLAAELEALRGEVAALRADIARLRDSGAR